MHGQQNIKKKKPKKCFDTDVVLRSNNLIFQEVQKDLKTFLQKVYFISPHITGHEQMSAIIRDVRTYARGYNVIKKHIFFEYLLADVTTS